MATTARKSPKQIAQQVIVAQWPGGYDDEEHAETIESLIMLGIPAYTDVSNQRPENLSEACRRLGINLHWVDAH